MVRAIKGLCRLTPLEDLTKVELSLHAARQTARK
ncbi:hypothetical protein BCh11DRAFT_07073 [Burkholderia sp. Ch1-1]|nr:hypothetical protein BCh11DRAFT_07073 [Burkholderia sp. Ch1-1]